MVLKFDSYDAIMERGRLLVSSWMVLFFMRAFHYQYPSWY